MTSCLLKLMSHPIMNGCGHLACFFFFFMMTHEKCFYILFHRDISEFNLYSKRT